MFVLRRFMDNCYHLCLPVTQFSRVRSRTIVCPEDLWTIAFNFACVSHNITGYALEQFVLYCVALCFLVFFFFVFFCCVVFLFLFLFSFLGCHPLIASKHHPSASWTGLLTRPSDSVVEDQYGTVWGGGWLKTVPYQQFHGAGGDFMWNGTERRT